MDRTTDAPAASSQPQTPPVAPPAPGWQDSEVDVPATPAPAFSTNVSDLAPDSLPTIGHIGRYALKYCIGTGGLGTVYAAHDPLLSRLIAIKTLNVELSGEARDSFDTLFLNEARAVGALSHPHIVTVYDAGLSDQGAYIAMELLKGRDLRQLLNEGWRPTPAQSALIVRRVADALAYAHAKGVIHCDIKPANIFMVGRTQPRVLDFGIARVAHHHDAQPDTDVGGGSPYYMAPEQLRQEAVDARTDVYSLGVVLYELLTGSRPFDGATLVEIGRAVLEHRPPAAHEVNPTVPAPLAAIVARAMEKDAEQRYRSARSLSRELRHWLTENSQAIELRRQQQRTRNRRGAMAGAAVAGIAAAVTGLALWMQEPAESVAYEAARAVQSAPTLAAAPAGDAADGAAVAAPADVAAEPLVVATPVEVAADPAVIARLAPPAAPPSASTEPSPAATTSEAPAPSASPGALSASASPEAAAASPAAADAPVQVPASLPVVELKPAPRPAAVQPSPRVRHVASVREARAAPSVKPVASRSGVVTVAVSPWGSIEVNGRPAGTTPPLNRLTLPAGSHQIIVRNSDFPPHRVTVEVQPDHPVVLRHRFGTGS